MVMLESSPEILRYAAFTDRADGGNRAGVVLDAGDIGQREMQEIARTVGYSETAFLVPTAARTFSVRYFSPEREVPFCGHATIASAVALAERLGAGPLILNTVPGVITVDTVAHDGGFTATLTSVAPHLEEVPATVVDRVLDALRWDRRDLNPELPVRISYAGARHLILAAGTRERLADLDYDFPGLKREMEGLDLITVNLVWRQDETTFHARNPFPVGGVIEDAATGAAAAALGGYLRELALVTVPSRISVHQGADMGRPSLLLIDLEPETPGIKVTGQAVRLEHP